MLASIGAVILILLAIVAGVLIDRRPKLTSVEKSLDMSKGATARLAVLLHLMCLLMSCFVAVFEHLAALAAVGDAHSSGSRSIVNGYGESLECVSHAARRACNGA